MSNIKNLRDVGSAINQILGENVLKEKSLFRSGELNQVQHQEELPNICTILNLRRTPDPAFTEIANVNVAPLETMNNYLIETSVFQEWVQRAFDTLAHVQWPLLLHCTAGKDRTGVLVAILLKNIGIPDQAIVTEYLLSDGNCYKESMENLLFRFSEHRHLQMSQTQRNSIQALLCV